MRSDLGITPYYFCLDLLCGMDLKQYTGSSLVEGVSCRTRPSLRGSLSGKESAQQHMPGITAALGLKWEGCGLRPAEEKKEKGRDILVCAYCFAPGSWCWKQHSLLFIVACW